jgi:hypothetical protein
MWSWRDKFDDYSVKSATVEYRKDRSEPATEPLYPHITQNAFGQENSETRDSVSAVVTHLS